MKQHELIASKDNARLKAARQIRDGRERSAIFIEGFRLADEALRSDITIRECFVTEAFCNGPKESEMLATLKARKVSISRCSEAAFRSIADTTNPQGIVLIADRPPNIESAQIFASKEPLLIVYCFEINDPANLGALMRTAGAAGASCLVLSPRSADPFSPKALRASMGAAFRLPTATNIEIEVLAKLAPAKKIQMIGTAAEAGDLVYEIDLRRPTIIVLGGEANGLPPEVLAVCSKVVRIPMERAAESLNLAVSGGIIIYEAVRQRLA
ncbi:MAG TPA: RNA methyltransferase [Pyrinomonadaceae bacterium]|nr:RNA methyltransferase [Pyrinomonadaceae bacterium]